MRSEGGVTEQRLGDPVVEGSLSLVRPSAHPPIRPSAEPIANSQ